METQQACKRANGLEVLVFIESGWTCSNAEPTPSVDLVVFVGSNQLSPMQSESAQGKMDDTCQCELCSRLSQHVWIRA